MVRVSSPAKLRPWSELTVKNGDGGGSWVGDDWTRSISELVNSRCRNYESPLCGRLRDIEASSQPRDSKFTRHNTK